MKSNIGPIDHDIPETSVQATVAAQQASSVLLANAMIAVWDTNGALIILRALLDQGSQSAFITKYAAQTLCLKRKKIRALVSGIGAKTQSASHAIDVSLMPRFQSEFTINTEAIILPRLARITNLDCDENDFDFINNLLIADHFIDLD